MDGQTKRIGGPDHGDCVDAAAARFGGARADWLDLSTGINPVPDQASYCVREKAACDVLRVPKAGAVPAAHGTTGEPGWQDCLAPYRIWTRVSYSTRFLRLGPSRSPIRLEPAS